LFYVIKFSLCLYINNPDAAKKIKTIKNNKIMKKLFFFFAMLASVAMSAQSGITITPVSADYANKTVTFKVSWLNNSRTGTHNSKVWVFVDYRTVTGNAPSGSWTRATINGTPTATSGAPSRETGNDKGFWLQGTSGSSGTYNATVTAELSNVPAQFNWCAFVSDYPPNATVNNGTYTFKGTPPFTLIAANGTTTQTVTGNTLAVSAMTITATTIKDKTECPGAFCIYTGNDLYIDPTHLCQQRTSGAKNWEAWIKDSRDNKYYRIIKMPDDKWWMAQNLNYRGVSYDCYGGVAANCSENNGVWYSHYVHHNSTTICPSGWHIPSVTEWSQIFTNRTALSMMTVSSGGTDELGWSATLTGWWSHEYSTWEQYGVDECYMSTSGYSYSCITYLVPTHNVCSANWSYADYRIIQDWDHIRCVRL
jgi:uncharacterized protein (TIGR02145 family)